MWLSLFDRAIAGVLAFVSAQLDGAIAAAAAALSTAPAKRSEQPQVPDVPPETNLAVQVRALHPCTRTQTAFITFTFPRRRLFLCCASSSATARRTC